MGEWGLPASRWIAFLQRLNAVGTWGSSKTTLAIFNVCYLLLVA